MTILIDAGPHGLTMDPIGGLLVSAYPLFLVLGSAALRQILVTSTRSKTLSISGERGIVSCGPAFLHRFPVLLRYIRVVDQAAFLCPFSFP